MTDFVRENVRKYSGIIEDKPKKKKRPKAEFQIFYISKQFYTTVVDFRAIFRL